MKLTKIISQHRRDFKGEYKCEFCNHIEIDKNMDSYDDNYFHQEVTPKMKCKSCGESTLSKGAEIQKVKTKYLEGQQV
jgi:transcription elongation factor Elf1